MSKKFGVRLRQALLDHIETEDPALHAELLELRSRHAQSYRKKMKKLAKRYGEQEPERGQPITPEMRGEDAVNRAVTEAVPDEPETVEEAGPASQAEALALLDKSIAIIVRELPLGRYDNHLKRMRMEEQDNKNRHGALKAIDKRLEEIS